MHAFAQPQSIFDDFDQDFCACSSTFNSNRNEQFERVQANLRAHGATHPFLPLLSLSLSHASHTQTYPIALLFITLFPQRFSNVSTLFIPTTQPKMKTGVRKNEPFSKLQFYHVRSLWLPYDDLFHIRATRKFIFNKLKIKIYREREKNMLMLLWFHQIRYGFCFVVFNLFFFSFSFSIRPHFSTQIAFSCGHSMKNEYFMWVSGVQWNATETSFVEMHLENERSSKKKLKPKTIEICRSVFERFEKCKRIEFEKRKKRNGQKDKWRREEKYGR